MIAVTSAFNREFADPLPPSEVRSIARSVGRWTWRKFSANGLSKIQAARATRPRRAKQTAVRVAAAKLPGSTAKAIADALSISVRTVRRNGASMRSDYEGCSLERSKPWSLESEVALAIRHLSFVRIET